MIKCIHFNVVVQSMKTLKLTREEFATINTKPSLPKFDYLVQKKAYTDSTATSYTVEWCEKYRILCLENFDINMKYFQSLDREQFEYALVEYLARHKDFRQITDLNDCRGLKGYYIMVLDEYKQVYIGKSDDIYRRIRAHWSKVKPLDRILFPMYNVKSVFSIDSFRALDTTRIYVWQKTLSEGIERELVKDFPNKFLCNRIGGDVVTISEAMQTMTKH